jgi:hypothetical protein
VGDHKNPKKSFTPRDCKNVKGKKKPYYITYRRVIRDTGGLKLSSGPSLKLFGYSGNISFSYNSQGYSLPHREFQGGKI